MKVSPDRPTPLIRFAAWCGLLSGAIGMPLFMRDGIAIDNVWLIASVLIFLASVSTLVWGRGADSAAPPDRGGR
jgi:hypothetical protein